MPYIEREKARELIKNFGKGAIKDGMKTLDPVDDIVLLQKFVDSIPTADVVEVKCSNWELKSRVYKMLDDVDEELYVECPLCHRTEYVPFELEEEEMLEYARKHYPYCHCGAKMDGKDGE